MTRSLALHATKTLPRAAKGLLALTVATAAAAGILLTVASGNAQAAGSSIYVDHASRHGACADTRDRDAASVSTRPVCTLARAARLAQPGDTVRVAAATYRETLTTSTGAPGAVLHWAAEPGVVLDVTGLRTGIKAIAAQDVQITGFTVRGAQVQAVWVERSARVTLDRVTLTSNPSAGLQVKDSSFVSLTNSTVSGNLTAGIHELGGVRDAAYTGNLIIGNGRDGKAYNGDGIQLQGARTVVRNNVIEGNGNDQTFEHGIYAAKAATGYLIEGNSLRDNAATNIKAEGSGVVARNTLGQAKLGMYIGASSGTGVTVEQNVVIGRYTHAVFVGTGANTRLTGNTLSNDTVVAAGQPTAVFVQAAGSVQLRNNLMVSRALTGRAVALPNPGAVAAFSADGNWYAVPGSLLGVWGTSSLKLADWRTRTGRDSATVASTPPLLAADGRVLTSLVSTVAGALTGL